MKIVPNIQIKNHLKQAYLNSCRIGSIESLVKHDRDYQKNIRVLKNKNWIGTFLSSHWDNVHVDFICKANERLNQLQKKLFDRLQNKAHISIND